MDAKPQRVRGLSRIRDENVLPSAFNVPSKPQLHHRNKSTPALTALVKPLNTNSNVINQVQPKRQAFADVSNTFKPLPAKEEMQLSKKTGVEKIQPAELKPLKDVTNNLPTQPSAVGKVNSFLRPAQRPMSTMNLRSTAQQHHQSQQQFLPPLSSHEPSFLAATKRALGLKSESLLQPLPQKQSLKVHTDPVVPSANAIHTAKEARSQIQERLASTSQPLPALPVQATLAGSDVVTKAVHGSQLTAAPITAQLPPLPEPVRTFEPVNASVLSEPIVNIAENRLEQTIVKPAEAPSIAAPLPTYDAPLPAVLPQPQQPVHLDRSAQYTGVNPGHWQEEEEEEYYDAEGYTTAHSFHGNNTTGQVTLQLQPRVNEAIRRELEEARLWVEANKVPEEENEEAWDTSMVQEYGDDIFDYMKSLEEKYRPNPHYMDAQTEIQWSMRAVLMDWLTQVHARFQLLPETLFLAVNYIDRFLSVKIVSMGKLQLVGACALFIAAKYEEINCPSVQEIIYMVDGGYTAEEILKAERFMLSMLKFELGWPGPMSFLRRISKADDYDLETRTLAKYFLEVTIMDERFVGCIPSFTSAAAHCLARLMLRKGSWSQAHVHYSGYTYSQLHDLLQIITECCHEPQKHHIAVFDKYSEKRYKRAAFFVQTELQRGFYVPAIPSPVHSMAAHHHLPIVPQHQIVPSQIQTGSFGMPMQPVPQQHTPPGYFDNWNSASGVPLHATVGALSISIPHYTIQTLPPPPPYELHPPQHHHQSRTH